MYGNNAYSCYSILKAIPVMTMRHHLLSVALLLLVAGCTQPNTDNDLITLDVHATYPKKELILQDFMDVEYIPLETTDEFITQGGVMAVGDKYLIVRNWVNDGNIFIFDRHTGKGIRKINRKGQGAEEYGYINSIILSEEKNELFVNSSQSEKVFVYDLLGNFKRSFPHTEGTSCMDVFNFDQDHLIRYDMSAYYDEEKGNRKQPNHAIISKQDGAITREIAIPFDKYKAPVVKTGDNMAVASVPSITPYHDNFLLAEASSDTVYHYITKENNLVPFLAKTPSVDTDMFLVMGTMTERYYFMHSMKGTFDFDKRRGFPTTPLMYDTEEKRFYEATVLNGDFTEKRTLNMTSRPINNKIATFDCLAAPQLVEAYEKEGLKGKLKEIAAGLDEEANPVIMLITYKK